MSVLIKGMEMPKAGNWKTIRIYYDGTCAEPNWQGDCKYMQGCEAVSVPPHGRLIDADAFEAFIRKDWDKNDHWIAEVVYSRPTIIQAEEGE